MAKKTSRSKIDSFSGTLFDVSFNPQTTKTSPDARAITNADKSPVAVIYTGIQDLAQDVIDDGTFDWYRPQSIRIAEAITHPTPLMESAALASTRPPVPTYQPILPHYLIRDGIISESQLECVIYAGEAHQRTIEVDEFVDETTHKKETCTYRQGYMLGDGAGAGKGRSCAACILDSYYHGRKKALWISANDRLYNDALRDYLATGGNEDSIVKLGSYKIGTPITLHEGVIFATYAMLRSSVKRKDQNNNEYVITRLEQILEWLGSDFDGVIIFDESQNMQNAMETVETDAWFAKKPSLQALAGLSIQKQLPLARVLYASATSGDHLEALAYAPRLGLWGKNTAFADRSDFIKTMTEGGITALEMICRDLKSAGVYCSRQLSADGITHETLIHELPSDQIDQMNSFNRAWRLISNGFEKALVTTGAAQNRGKSHLPIAMNAIFCSRIRSRLESAKQRFYMLALISMRVPTIIEHMKTKLQNDESCILQIHNTQQAALERALEVYDKNPGTDLDTLDLSPRRELIEFVRECFPTQQHSQERNKRGEYIAIAVVDPITGLPIQNASATELRDNLIADLETLLIPESPIDMFFDAFGANAIAEVTGRKRRVIWESNLNGRHRAIQARGVHANEEEIEAFNNGDKRILIFSDSSGGVGASYHADLTFANKTRRNHYLVQIPWRSIDAVQSMGRSNRTNQASAPHYILTTTNVPSELRFISTIAKRLDQLGSLTRGQRDANATYVFSSDDNLETKYGEAALKEMIHAINNGKVPEVSKEMFYEQTGLDPQLLCQTLQSATGRGQTVTIPRFLNRLLAVDLDKDGGYQRILLNDLIGRIQDLKEQAILDGSYDAGLQTIAPLSLKKVDDTLLQKDSNNGAETRLACLERIETLRPTSFSNAQDKLRFFQAFNPNDQTVGFVTDPTSGDLYLQIPVRNIVPLMVSVQQSQKIRMITPFGENLRTRYDSVRYKKVATPEAEKIWNEIIANGPKTQTNQFFVVYGALLPIWDRFTKSMPKIWRMQTDDGERILGRVIPKHEVPEFKKSFGL